MSLRLSRALLLLQRRLLQRERDALTASSAALHTLSTRAPLRTGPSESAGSTEGVLESHYPPTPLFTGGVVEYLLDRCTQHSNSDAMVDGETGRALKYGALIDGLQRWGAVVQSRGQQGAPAPVVAIFMHNCIEYPMIFLGTMAVGSTVTPLNPSYTPAEVCRQLADSGASLLVVDGSLEVTAIKALEEIKDANRKAGATVSPLPELFVCGESKQGSSDIRTLLFDSAAPFASPVTVSPESIAMLPYSSGTTGRPKGVCVKHGAMTACLGMMDNPIFYTSSKSGAQDVVMGLLPFYHIYGIQAIMAGGLSRASKLITLPNFQKNTFIKAIRDYKPTLMPTVPPILKFLVESREVTSEDLQYCHTVGCGAAPVSKATVERFQEKTKGNKEIFFQEGYGMTEILITHATPRTDPKIGFCGKLLPHTTARVVNTETGQAVPPGTKGELLVKTPCMMAGYHNNPEATAETIDSDGWLHTGDIVVYQEDGFFSIVDRIKELIKCKGLQVAPSEVEDALLQLPGVADAGVVGVPHPRHGEVPRAYVVRSDRHPNLAEEELQQHLSQRLAPHKQLLGGVKFVEELPKNPTGKLLRRVLKQIAEKEP